MPRAVVREQCWIRRRRIAEINFTIVVNPVGVSVEIENVRAGQRHLKSTSRATNDPRCAEIFPRH